MRERTLLLLQLGAIFLAAPAGTQTVPSTDEVSLFPGDMIGVRVWREEDLSGEFVVDQNGQVTLPLLGARPVTGRSWSAVKDELLQAYSQELRNPSIELTPFRRVLVLGEVNRPGLYPIHPTNLSLAGAVAVAGGATTQGDIRKVKLIRDGRVILERVAGESSLASLDIRSGDQIFVDRRGWFDRNSTFLVSALLSVTSIVVTLVAK